MKHQRFLTRLLNRPQLITPAAGAAVVHALMPGIRVDGYDGQTDPVQRDPREYTVTGRTAVIPVVGELVHRGGGMDAMSGLCSYQDLQDMLSDAVGDASVTGIVLDIDSPGGEAGGNLDLAAWLAAQRGAKPIFASINSQACSGAYSIASAADRVMIGQDGMAGSIGVVTYHTDLSRALANQGVVVTYVYAGDRKIDGNPAQPLSEEAEASIQDAVNTIYGRFCDVVAANRGMSLQAVKNTQAGVFLGQAAITAGLADQIATLEDALIAVATRSASAGARLTVNRPAGATRMADSDAEVPLSPAASPAEQPIEAPAHTGDGQPGALPIDAPDERRPNQPASPGFGPADPVAVAEACAAAGHSELTVGLLRSKASMADVRADIDRAKGITEAAAKVRQVAMAGPAIAGGVSLEIFRRMAFAATASAEAPISTGHKPSASPQAQAPISGREVNARKNDATAAAAARR